MSFLFNIYFKISNWNHKKKIQERNELNLKKNTTPDDMYSSLVFKLNVVGKKDYQNLGNKIFDISISGTLPRNEYLYLVALTVFLVPEFTYNPPPQKNTMSEYSETESR